MKERPILFSAPMVRAILDGSKTQTRRAFSAKTIKNFEVAAQLGEITDFLNGDIGKFDLGYILEFCPYGKVGDRLWVREKFQPFFVDNWEHLDYYPNYKTGEGYKVSYPATDGIKEWLDGDENLRTACKPSIHMPRWASRINLEITNVRVERLRDISRNDAIAEGVDWKKCPSHQTEESYRNQKIARSMGMAATYTAEIDYIGGFKILWESINGEGSWNQNQWVWVIEFKKV